MLTLTNWTRIADITAPTKNSGFRVPKKSYVINQTLDFQIKFCVKSPALLVAANREVLKKYPTRINYSGSYL